MSLHKILDQQLHPCAEGCNHPSAVLFDPSDKELSELEAMLARCPVCSRWSPGHGPIMAVVSSANMDHSIPDDLLTN